MLMRCGHLLPKRDFISTGCAANAWDALTRELNFGMDKTNCLIIVRQPLKQSILFMAFLTEGVLLSSLPIT